MIMINNEWMQCQENSVGPVKNVPPLIVSPPVMRGNNVLLLVPATQSDKKTRAKDIICSAVSHPPLPVRISVLDNISGQARPFAPFHANYPENTGVRWTQSWLYLRIPM